MKNEILKKEIHEIVTSLEIGEIIEKEHKTILRDIRNETKLPLCVYNVSGEYAMLKHAGLAGLIDYERVMIETMIAFKRAGANIIISYHAKEVCEILNRK